MKRKLTLTISDSAYNALHRRVGRGQIAKFVEDLIIAGLGLVDDPMEEGYRAMMADTEQEKEAEEWISSEIGECLPAYEEDWSGWDA